VKYTAIILGLAVAGVLIFCASLFDNATMIVVVISLAIVCLFGTLPVLLGVITRRAGGEGKSADGQPGDDEETVRFDSKKE
jgi:cadmium resistance protein CadD (predicted permease)